MGIHSDSVYQDVQQEVETKTLKVEDGVKVEDTTDGGKLTLYDETGTKQGEILLSSDGKVFINSITDRIELQRDGHDIMRIDNFGITMRDKLFMANNRIKSIDLFEIFTVKSSEPSPSSEGNVYLDDGTNTSDGNPHFRYYNGTSWVDL